MNKIRPIALALSMTTPALTGCEKDVQSTDGSVVIYPLPVQGEHAFFSPETTEEFCADNPETHIVCHNVEEPEECNPEGVSNIIRTDLSCKHPDLELIMDDVFSNGNGTTPQKAFCQTGPIGAIDSRPSNFPGVNCIKQLNNKE